MQKTDQALELFAEALDLPSGDRPAFLGMRCRDNPDLRRRVESLLAHDSAAGDDFLAAPPSGPMIGPLLCDDADPLIGSTIGAYTIKRLIARGGMGAVYLAEQANPRRDVALKVLHGGPWSKSLERRFDVESRILAYLQHPNIAQIHEAGTAIPSPSQGEGQGEGPHHLWSHPVRYFAMEYVPDARPLTKYADGHRLDLDQRLELFLQLCDAVHHGHQKGIIHRDLKPANILIGTEPTRDRSATPGGWRGVSSGDSLRASVPSCLRASLKVIDFGIARTTDSDIAVTTLHTEVGQILGTLAYMSPEQLGGMGVSPVSPADIDNSSDIYSLGVILYELLTGRMPYDVSNMTIHSAARVICEKEPTPPSAFNRRLPGDAQTIILKAIEKDPARRYSTVMELAADIRRLVNREPIAARKPTPYSRLLRWAARRPTLAIATSSVLIASLVMLFTLVAVWWVNARPDRIEMTVAGKTTDYRGDIARHGDLATLYSFAGRRIASWSARSEGGITGATIISASRLLSGERFILMGLGRMADSPYRRELCLFDADGPYDEPRWHRTVESSHIEAMPEAGWPRPAMELDRRYASEGFSISRVWVHDVFPEHQSAGPEIVASHSHHPGSQVALRIYNLNGDLLFQAWQDGGVHDVAWLPEEKLLICAAIKGDMDGNEYSPTLAFQHPLVIFAIEPVLGGVSNKWIHPHPPGLRPRFVGDPWKAEWYEPAWYKMVCPSTFADSSAYAVRFNDRDSLPHPCDSGRYLQLEVDSWVGPQHPADRVLFNIILDQEGNIAKHLTPNDGLRRALKENPNLPNPETFQLLDWKTPDPPCP